MKKKYSVEVVQSRTCKVEIWADSEENAKELAETLVDVDYLFEKNIDFDDATYHSAKCSETDLSFSEEDLKVFLNSNSYLKSEYEKIKEKQGCSESFEHVMGDVLYSITELGYEDVFSNDINDFTNPVECVGGLYIDIDYCEVEMESWMDNYKTK